MGTRGLGVVLIGLALAGCGDEGDGAATTTRPEPSPAAQDARAKSDARVLTSYVESCFADQQDYSRCRDAARGEDVGVAAVVRAGTATFTIASLSESGNEFRIDRTAAGTVTRTCTRAGNVGCPASGRW